MLYAPTPNFILSSSHSTFSFSFFELISNAYIPRALFIWKGVAVQVIATDCYCERQPRDDGFNTRKSGGERVNCRRSRGAHIGCSWRDSGAGSSQFRVTAEELTRLLDNILERCSTETYLWTGRLRQNVSLPIQEDRPTHRLPTNGSPATADSAVSSLSRRSNGHTSRI
jgi:hypothetical protein